MKRVISILFALLPVILPAQVMTLEDAINIAQDSTIKAYAYQNALQRAEADYEVFLSTRRPHLSLNLNPSFSNYQFSPNTHTLKENDLKNEVKSLTTYGELKFEQKALGIGGTFYATANSILSNNFLGTNRNLFAFSPIGIGYSNSLIGYNQNKWDKIINDYHNESDRIAYQYNLYKIATETESLYIDCIVKAQQYEICLRNEEVARKMYSIGKEKFAIASISKNELFTLEVQELNAENSLYSAKIDLDNAKRALSSYLNIDYDFSVEIPNTPEYISIDIEEAIANALKNNPSYRNSYEDVLSANANDEMVKAQTAALRTSIDIQLGIQNIYNLNETSNPAFKQFVSGGVTLKIPIIDGGEAKNRRKASGYNIQYMENLSKEAERELSIDVTVSIKEFSTQQELLQSTLQAIEIADESFELAKDLYGNGDIDINTFILAQNRKDESYSNYLNTLKRYWDSLFHLEAICVTDFH